jgi:hypothetical protein
MKVDYEPNNKDFSLIYICCPLWKISGIFFRRSSRSFLWRRSLSYKETIDLLLFVTYVANFFFFLDYLRKKYVLLVIGVFISKVYSFTNRLQILLRNIYLLTFNYYIKWWYSNNWILYFLSVYSTNSKISNFLTGFRYCICLIFIM